MLGRLLALRLPRGEGRVTLLRRRALGDVVLLGSITAPLAERGLSVTVMTDPLYVPLVERLRGVARATPVGSPPDGVLVDLQRDWKSRAAYPLSPVLRKHTLSRLRLLLGLGGRRPSVPEIYGEAAAVPPCPPPWFDLPARPRDTLALAPGAATDLKRWSPERLSAVGRAWPGPVLVIGGPREEELCSAVARGIPGAQVLCERGFQGTLEALAQAKVVLAGDTGLLHLGAACGARPVALFGPTHPADGFFPYREGRVVQLSLPCRPCTRHRATRCREGHHGCMGQDISSVLSAVMSCAS